jgi:hypothetical protein
LAGDDFLHDRVKLCSAQLLLAGEIHRSNASATKLVAGILLFLFPAALSPPWMSTTKGSWEQRFD